MDLALNNQQRWICHKTQTTNLSWKFHFCHIFATSYILLVLYPKVEREIICVFVSPLPTSLQTFFVYNITSKTIEKDSNWQVYLFMKKSSICCWQVRNRKPMLNNHNNNNNNNNNIIIIIIILPSSFFFFSHVVLFDIFSFWTNWCVESGFFFPFSSIFFLSF